jgi:hypothetical protein
MSMFHRRHLSEGQLRAYLDGELSGGGQQSVQQHLSGCAYCQAQADELSTRSARLRNHLAMLTPLPSEGPTTSKSARQRLQTYTIKKETPSMLRKVFSQYRFAWIALALVALLALALTFPSVQALANSFLGLFRVQKIAAVPFNPANLPANFDGESIVQLISDDVKAEKLGEYQEVATAEEASALAGFPIRLPTGLEGQSELSVQPGMRLSMTVDLPRIRAILEEMGQSGIQLPDSLDGAAVSAELLTSVTAVYGNCRYNPDAGEDPDAPRPQKFGCTTLVQAPSPTIDAPEGLDIAQIGKAYLQLIGMSAEEAESFSQSIDWATTLVIPVPGYAEYQDVIVDGVSGVMLLENPEYVGTPYLVLWVKNGMVYALNGYGGSAEALRIANSLK